MIPPVEKPPVGVSGSPPLMGLAPSASEHFQERPCRQINRQETGLQGWFHRFERDLLDGLARAAASWGPARRRKLGCLLASFARDLMRIRWLHTVDALGKHLGISRERALSLARKVYDSFFENAVEMASLPYLTAQDLLTRIRVTGLENLREAQARGCGVVLISGHYGLWELMPPWLCLNGFRLTVVVRRQKNLAVDAWMEFMRRQHGVVTTDSGFSLREVLRTLRQGHLLGLMSDQDAGDKGIFARFFGEEASTVPGPAAIALKTGAPLVTLALHPSRPPIPHHLEICRPIFPEAFPDSAEGRQALTQAYTDILEGWIRRRPEQWFWLHRRWKTRPR